MKPTIHLLGDAILDNYYHLDNSDRDLRKELIDLGYEVNNCAVDGVKVSNLIKGIVPSNSSRKYPYPISSDGKMYPLKSVLDHIGINRNFNPIYSDALIKKSTNNNMIVISLGGKDIHSKIANIIFGNDNLINSVLTEEFISTFKKVISNSRKSCSKIVLVSIYLPYLGPGSSYGIYAPFSKGIISRWNKFIYELGKEFDIPVLDLSKTLNVNNRKHYGKDDTRISDVSNKCMSKCINYIYNNYNGFNVYYCKDCDIKNITTEF